MTTYRGRVVRRPFAEGSKSEHEAIVLETDQGAWALRRVGANPFVDEELAQHVGRRVAVDGRVHRGVLFADTITPEGGGEPGDDAGPEPGDDAGPNADPGRA